MCDQNWAELDERIEIIYDITYEGSTVDDKCIVQAVFNLVAGELHLRRAEGLDAEES